MRNKKWKESKKNILSKKISDQEKTIEDLKNELKETKLKLQAEQTKSKSASKKLDIYKEYFKESSDKYATKLNSTGDVSIKGMEAMFLHEFVDADDQDGTSSDGSESDLMLNDEFKDDPFILVTDVDGQDPDINFAR